MLNRPVLCHVERLPGDCRLGVGIRVVQAVILFNKTVHFAAEAGKMNGFIEEYHRLHDADTDAETAISRQALHTA